MSDDKKSDVSRRQFVVAAAGAAAGVIVPSKACSYARIRGANDRIQIGMLGCGARAEGLLNMIGMSKKDGNLALRSVCDIWTTTVTGCEPSVRRSSETTRGPTRTPRNARRSGSWTP